MRRGGVIRDNMRLCVIAAALIALAAHGAQGAPPAPPVGLLIDGEASPQHVVNLNPTVTWELGDPDDEQAAFFVIWGTQRRLDPAPGQGPLGNPFRSGRVESSQQTYTMTTSHLLLQGHVWYWHVGVWNGDGEWSTWSEAGSFKMNTMPTPPQSLRVDGNYNPRGVHGPAPVFSWTFLDYDEGDTQSAYLMIVASSEEQIAENTGDIWDSGKVISDQSEALYAGPALEQGIRYYWKGRVWDNHGTESRFCGANSFTMGTPPLPPQNPMIEDQVNPGLIHKATPIFSWTFSDPDMENDVHEQQGAYRILVASDAGLLDAESTDVWDSGKVESANSDIVYSGSPLPGGMTYYWKAMVWDAYGLGGDWTATQSFGLAALSSPAFVVDGIGTDKAYQHATDTLSANWDVVLMAKSYWFAFGAAPGGDDIVPWTDNGLELQVTATGLELEPGATYYASVRAREESGAFSEVRTSSGVLVDSTPGSAVSFVNDGVAGPDIQWTASTDRLAANWGPAEDAESGIAYYRFAIGTEPGGADIADWASAGNNTVASRSGLSLQQGATYYFSVKSVNGAGLVSEARSSSGVTVVAAPKIVSTAGGSALVSRPYQYNADDRALATGAEPMAWSVFSGPAGFDIDALTGAVSWTPAVSGNITIIIRAENMVGYDEQVFTVEVKGPVIVSQPSSSAFVGLPYYYDPDNSAAAEADGPVRWEAVVAPPGFEIHPTTGLITWTPTGLGKITVSIKATDAYSYDIQTFTVVVRALGIRIEPGQINIVLVENLDQPEAELLGDAFVFEQGDYRPIDLTSDIDGPTAVIAYPPNPGVIEILPGLQSSYGFEILPGWNSVPNPFEVSIAYNDFHFAFAAAGRESEPLSQSEHVAGYAVIWLEDEFKRIPDQTHYIPPQTGFFVYSLAEGALHVSR